MHRGVRTPPQARLHPIALIEDEASIQAALMEVINALMRNTMDLKRAALILRALHIAVKNASRVKIGLESRSAVTEIPNYAIPDHRGTEQVDPDHVGMDRVGTAHVGTDAFVRPAKAKPSPPTTAHVETAALGRQATPQASAPTPNLNAAQRPYSELDIPASAQPDSEIERARLLYEPPPILTAAERAQRRAELEAAMAECRQQAGAPSLSRSVRQGGDFPAQVTADGQAHLTTDVEKSHAETDHVGTAALGCPAKAKPSAPSDHVASSNGPRKKPPANVKHSLAPKERKIAAHAVRHGSEAESR
jgi:hypothetical protein